MIMIIFGMWCLFLMFAFYLEAHLESQQEYAYVLVSNNSNAILAVSKDETLIKTIRQRMAEPILKTQRDEIALRIINCLAVVDDLMSSTITRNTFQKRLTEAEGELVQATLNRTYQKFRIDRFNLKQTLNNDKKELGI